MKIPESVKSILRPVYVPVANFLYKTFRAPKRYHHLFDTIREKKATSILEIGVWNGKRAVEMIHVAKESAPSVSYFGYDLFEDLGEEGYRDELSKRPPTQKEVQTLLESTGANVRLFQGNTLETLRHAGTEVGKVDFIFIDGGHSVSTIQSDWNNIEACMHERTVVIFDDYWQNRTDAGCKPVVDAIDQSKYDVTILPEIDIFNNPDFGRLEIRFARVTKK